MATVYTELNVRPELQQAANRDGAEDGKPGITRIRLGASLKAEGASHGTADVLRHLRLWLFLIGQQKRQHSEEETHTNTHQLNQCPEADFIDRGESPVTRLAPTLRLQCQRKTEFLATIKLCRENRSTGGRLTAEQMLGRLCRAYKSCL